MGIHNIHILSEPQKNDLALKAQIALKEKLLLEHRRGQHKWGSMRRECPLCQIKR